MGKEEAIKIAERYLKKISGNYSIINALLFGSYAKGTNNEDSDIDIALVMKNVPDIIDAQIELMKLRRDIDLRIEPHPFREEDFEIDDPVVYEIMNHGVRINN